MNRVDCTILRILQEDCRLSVSEIASRINLSTSACHRRIKLLEKSGKIEDYRAHLNPKHLGYRILVYVEFSLSSQTNECLNDFEEAVKNCQEVLECHQMAGDADYLVKVAARSTDHYERIHRQKLSNLPGIARMKSNFVLKTIQPWKGYLVE